MAVADGKVKVNWQPAHEVESYKLLTVQGNAVVGTTTIDGQQTQFITVPLAPLTRYCFSLESVRGSIHSSQSSPACAATAAAATSQAPASGAPSSGASSGTTQAGGGSGSTTPSGGTGSSSGQSSSSGTAPPGGIQPGDWIVVFATYLDAAGNAQQRADSAVSALSSSFAAQTLHSTDYPNWIWNGAKIIHPFWAVYVGTKTLDATNQLLFECRSRGFTCVSTQPAG
jgi:hypothetical protein